MKLLKIYVGQGCNGKRVEIFGGCLSEQPIGWGCSEVVQEGCKGTFYKGRGMLIHPQESSTLFQARLPNEPSPTINGESASFEPKTALLLENAHRVTKSPHALLECGNSIKFS